MFDIVHIPPESQLILIGGGALSLLGSPCLTIDIDFVGDDVHPSEFHRFIMQIAKELKIDVEPVPLDRFVSLPVGSTDRQIRIGPFENLETYVADPYSFALSKLDHSFFDTDFDDIIFLIRQNLSPWTSWNASRAMPHHMRGNTISTPKCRSILKN